MQHLCFDDVMLTCLISFSHAHIFKLSEGFWSLLSYLFLSAGQQLIVGLIVVTGGQVDKPLEVSVAENIHMHLAACLPIPLHYEPRSQFEVGHFQEHLGPLSGSKEYQSSCIRLHSEVLQQHS